MKITVNINRIKEFCGHRDISYLGLFGSQVRGDSRRNSDLDVLIDFKETKSFFELARVQEALEKIFNKKVDLVLKSNIKSSLKPYIFNDLTTIYEKR